jgi:hypothetical protein
VDEGKLLLCNTLFGYYTGGASPWSCFCRDDTRKTKASEIKAELVVVILPRQKQKRLSMEINYVIVVTSPMSSA